MPPERVVFHDFVKQAPEGSQSDVRLDRIEAQQRIILQELATERQSYDYSRSQPNSRLDSAFWVYMKMLMIVVTILAAIASLASTNLEAIQSNMGLLSANSLISKGKLLPATGTRGNRKKTSAIDEAKRLQREIQRECRKTLGCADRTGAGNKLY